MFTLNSDHLIHNQSLGDQKYNGIWSLTVYNNEYNNMWVYGNFFGVEIIDYITSKH